MKRASVIFLLFGFLIGFIKTVPLSEFFPYGTSVNDQLFYPNDDDSTSALTLPGVFPYFNNNHRQIYLANNGLFSFLGPISQFSPTPFPLSDGRRLIAAFWSDIDTRGSIPSGNKVFYQIYGSSQRSNVVFSKAATYVREYFPGERSFEPSMIITGTWYRVGAFSSQTACTNTFQIVLATDELRSFAFILYHDLQWASPNSGTTCTPTSGELGGQAGFNAGDGYTFQMLPYSRTNNVRQLVNASNVNVPGLFTFRIDTDTVTLGGCGNQTSLTFRPRRGSQLGGTALVIQGPCFTNISAGAVRCRFGESVVVTGTVIDEMRAICITPAFSHPSIENVHLSMDGGNTFRLFPSTFTITRAEYGFTSLDNAEVVILNHTNTIIVPNEYVTLGWYLSAATIDSWSNINIRLDIEMHTVMLNVSNGGITETGNIVVRSNVSPTPGYQLASFLIPALNNLNLAIVFFRVVARDNDTNIIYGGLNSALMIYNDTISIAESYCQAWSSVQPQPSTWNEDLLPCPMTLAQARVARCCYEPDPLCRLNNYNFPANCALRRGRQQYDEESAVACYISTRTNIHNAGTECCYSEAGQLITRGTGAGTDDRFRPASRPILHLFSDELPFLACCHLSSDPEYCERYFTYRPPRRGSNSPFTWGGTWGDPHFNTLDGASYTFNGYGEYTYLAISNRSVPVNSAFTPSTLPLIFEAQVRTTPLSTTSGMSASTATVIRGIAAMSNEPNASNMSVTVSRREFLIVRRGNETIDLNENSADSIGTNNSLILFFPEMTLEYNRTSRVLILSWFVGVSIQITPITVTTSTATATILNVGVSVAGIHQHHTFGLLGYYDGIASNDLQAANGILVGQPSSLSLQQIHQQFGQTWTIDPRRSLFYYEIGDSAQFYANITRTYIPSFTLPNPSPAQLSATLAACNINPSSTNRSAWTMAQETCYYDISVTNDISLGHASRTAADAVVQIANDERSPPEFNNGLMLTLNVLPLSSVTINFTAVSPYTSTVYYSLTRGPAGSSLDNQTALFRWQVPASGNNDTIVRVNAQDGLYGLVSSYEILLRVDDTANTTSTTTTAAITTTATTTTTSTTTTTTATTTTTSTTTTTTITIRRNGVGQLKPSGNTVLGLLSLITAFVSIMGH